MIPFSYENPPAFLKYEEYYLLEVTWKKDKPKRIIAEWNDGSWCMPGIDYDACKARSKDYTINIIAEINTTTLKMKKLTPPRRPVESEILTPIAKSALESIDTVQHITIHEFIKLYYELYNDRHLDPQEVIESVEANCERLGFSKNVTNLYMLMDAQQTKYKDWDNARKR